MSELESCTALCVHVDRWYWFWSVFLLLDILYLFLSTLISQP